MISYTETGIIITDDYDPSKPPLVLPVGATPAEVAMQHSAHQSPAEPQPDWHVFVNWLLHYPPMAGAMQAARESTAPQGEPVTSSLPALVLLARDGDHLPFATAWPPFLAAAGAPAEALQPIVTQALACHLPAEFVAALTPGPAE